MNGNWRSLKPSRGCTNALIPTPSPISLRSGQPSMGSLPSGKPPVLTAEHSLSGALRQDQSTHRKRIELTKIHECSAVPFHTADIDRAVWLALDDRETLRARSFSYAWTFQDGQAVLGFCGLSATSPNATGWGYFAPDLSPYRFFVYRTLVHLIMCVIAMERLRHLSVTVPVADRRAVRWLDRAGFMLDQAGPGPAGDATHTYVWFPYIPLHERKIHG